MVKFIAFAVSMQFNADIYFGLTNFSSNILILVS